MKSDCIYYIPANYAVCATCQIGGYCNQICERFIHKNARNVEITKQGVSTTQAGQEKFVYFQPAHPKKTYVQYDYRTPEGKLFSCVKQTLNECRASRDQWLESNNLKKKNDEN